MWNIGFLNPTVQAIMFPAILFFIFISKKKIIYINKEIGDAQVHRTYTREKMTLKPRNRYKEIMETEPIKVYSNHPYKQSTEKETLKFF